ncbi:hypothetical protein FLO80_09720 [Aquicoccus porphyridii]|uniref:Uncharacterized protein n=1 Tax=Aquicoccus porphyridii TaxID=1852029 RepID=A0A5A9ZGQ8_9RHOB|nr:hypothetical protein [Aquicoccus porphyridii]KAA0916374.1 hypothetical protein FLO80_09720 [Aquicoccus porphyridii]
MRLYFSKDGLNILRAILAIFGIGTLYLYGSIQIIPSELHSFIDAHFIFYQTSTLTFSIATSALIASVLVETLGPAKIKWILFFSSKERASSSFLKKFYRSIRIVCFLTRRRKFALQGFIFVLSFGLIYLGFPYFYFVLVIGGVGLVTAMVIFARTGKHERPEIDSVDHTKLIFASILGAGITAFALGNFHSVAKIKNYVEVVSDFERTSGAVLGTTSSGIFLLENFNWKTSLLSDTYAVVFIPYGSFDYIQASPIKVSTHLAQ